MREARVVTLLFFFFCFCRGKFCGRRIHNRRAASIYICAGMNFYWELTNLAPA